MKVSLPFRDAEGKRMLPLLKIRWAGGVGLGFGSLDRARAGDIIGIMSPVFEDCYTVR
jgi:hypothetical protein